MRGMFVTVEMEKQKIFKIWMLVLFWVTLLLFSIVKTKIVHYSSLCWFPLTFIASLAIFDYWYASKKPLPIWIKILIGLTGIPLAVLITAVPYLMMYKDKWADKVDDAFARGNLEAVVHWSWIDGIGGIIMLSGIFFYLISKSKTLKIKLLFGSLTLCCFFTSVILATKVEAFSQRANIEFFEARQGEDCYVETWQYKSYAQYFYTMKKPFINDGKQTIDSLLKKPLDKPLYISAKITNHSYLDTLQGVQKLYSKNGFVFYKKMPAAK